VRLPVLRRGRPAPAPELPVRIYAAVDPRRAHLMLAGVPLCPFSPGPGERKGTGGDGEREFAAILPTCKLCLAALPDGTVP
jgi:hypothetical protein